MQIGTKVFTVGSLLNRMERRRVVLPAFQRSFSWETAQVSTFWDDLIAFESEFSKAPKTASYFLGSIVLIERDEDYLILDGQQRLATATITLAAVRDYLRTLKIQAATDLARDIQRELIQKDADPVTFALSLSELDQGLFLKAVQTDPPAWQAIKMRSHVLIEKAYRHSKERVEGLARNKTPEDTVKLLSRLVDSLTKGVSLVAILVGSEDDAYMIFESLNDRGLRLSVPDLVLNLLMKRSEDETSRKLVRNEWNEMLRELGRRDASRFLRHMWVSQYGDLKSQGLYAAIRGELDRKRLNSLAFAEQCSEEGDDYVAILDASLPLTKPGVQALEALTRYLRVESAPPLLLAGYRSLDPGDFEILMDVLIRTHVRYVVMANRNPMDLESALYDCARLVRTRRGAGDASSRVLGDVKQRLRTIAVSDDAIRDSAKDVVLEASEARWLMLRLANRKQSATGEIGMDRANLEHVFPQKSSAAAWPNRSDLEPLIWNLGNLTILGEKLNRKAQNKSFADKCTNYYTRSEIALTQEILRWNAWDPAAIAARATELGKLAAAVWPAV